MAKTDLTAARLRELLHYNPETGVFTWLVRRGMYPAGTVAGNICKDGRINMNIDKVRCMAHQAAWLYVHGQWPQDIVDHIDGDNTNNRVSNLRVVDRIGNAQNIHRARSHSGSGFLGVYKVMTGPNWHARITTKGKRVNLGTYKTPELAHQAYLDAKRILHSTCTI